MKHIKLSEDKAILKSQANKLRDRVLKLEEELSVYRDQHYNCCLDRIKELEFFLEREKRVNLELKCKLGIAKHSDT